MQGSHYSFVCAVLTCLTAAASALEVSVEQLTHGPAHHFYGYIGHVGNTPWNADGRHMVLLRSSFQDHMPGLDEPADIVLLDTANENAIEKLTETRGWNFQQGAMLYWHPKEPATQFFFNDIDPESKQVFCVRYDITRRERVQEYRFEDAPVGNSGVLPDGTHFLALNYGRLARLRPVTGYPAAFDWTAGDTTQNPGNDGIWKVNIESGKKELLISYAQLEQALQGVYPAMEPLFINHSLSSRDSAWVYAYARAGWHNTALPERVDAPFVIGMDGSGLEIPLDHIGGHPEWAPGNLVIGGKDGEQVVYDPFTRQVVRTIGTPELISRPGGDIALSFDGAMFINGRHHGAQSCYIILHLETGAHTEEFCLPIGEYRSGDLRIDPAPCWRRDGKALAVPALAADGTRQTFLLHLK